MTPAGLPGPDLTVVLVCPAGRRSLHRTLAAVAAQTIADRSEVLVVTPDGDVEAAERRLLNRFHSHRVVHEATIPDVDRASAHWLPEGTAPLVASVEDHADPEPDCARRLPATDDDGCVAVRSAVANTNSRAMLSWSNLLIAYDPCSSATPSGAMASLPLHDCSYRKSALSPYRQALTKLFIGLVADGAGQIAGFLAGPGGSRDHVSVFEMDRSGAAAFRSLRP